jgi:hypothetical protein
VLQAWALDASQKTRNVTDSTSINWRGSSEKIEDLKQRKLFDIEQK